MLLLWLSSAQPGASGQDYRNPCWRKTHCQLKPRRWHLFLAPICSSSTFTTCGSPPRVPSCLGGCQLSFLAALGVGNEQLQTSLPPHYSQGLLELLLLSLAPGCHDQRLSSLTAGHRYYSDFWGTRWRVCVCLSWGVYSKERAYSLFSYVLYLPAFCWSQVSSVFIWLHQGWFFQKTYTYKYTLMLVLMVLERDIEDSRFQFQQRWPIMVVWIFLKHHALFLIQLSHRSPSVQGQNGRRRRRWTSARSGCLLKGNSKNEW